LKPLAGLEVIDVAGDKFMVDRAKLDELIADALREATETTTGVQPPEEMCWGDVKTIYR